MDKEKLRVLICDFKQLVAELESEVFSDTESYVQEYDYSITDYDEVFEDTDGY